MKVRSQYYRPPRIFFTAESGIAISRFHPETEKTIDPVYSVNPAYPACLVKSLLGHLCWVGPADRTGVKYEKLQLNRSPFLRRLRQEGG